MWSDREPEILQVHPRDLPWNVLPEMVELAIDVDGDHQVDALKVNFCCKNPTRAFNCEYGCGGFWYRFKGTWYDQTNKTIS